MFFWGKWEVRDPFENLSKAWGGLSQEKRKHQAFCVLFPGSQTPGGDPFPEPWVGQ